MPSITATGSTAANTAAPVEAARVPQKKLGQNDFLKLLATQFKTQDPMKPMEDTAFIAQMAQFSSLEQSSSMAVEMAAMRTDQARSAANSYLGHRVTVDAGDGKTVSGDVTAIDATGASPRLVVDGTPYSLSAVLRVEPAFVSAPAPQPAPASGA
jgi:flagellar basal-body rod modification protein FlgD